ncbi:MAG: ATP-binding cassette domain-containing protein [Erysipelotrichaceae bacterium]|nr:ATP-binding cassette domain-containing protein [Erysipelotrichaceae bacterium]
MNKVLEIKDLSFGYDHNLILNNLSLEVFVDEFVAIVGANGAGKSTLLNLILHNLKTDQGSILLFGDDRSHYQDIAYISQNSVLNYRNFPTTINEVVKIHLKYLKLNKDIDYYLELVNLIPHKHKTLSELSGGQLQRVGVLLALLKDAKLIILDEPTTGIDKKFSIELFKMLKQLTTIGKSIIMVTHQLDDALEYVDRVYEIEAGTCKLKDSINV